MSRCMLFVSNYQIPGVMAVYPGILASRADGILNQKLHQMNCAGEVYTPDV
jgi:hypothetical protein